MSKGRKKTNFLLAIALLITWICFSWIIGPTQKSIDENFIKVNSSKENVYYIIDYNPKLMANGIHFKEVGATELDKTSFTLSDRNVEIQKSLLNYYKPFLQQAQHTDTLKYIDKNIIEKKFLEMNDKFPADTIINNTKYDIFNEPWALYYIFLKDSNHDRYYSFSLNSFSDINNKFRGGASNSFEKFTDVSDRINELIDGEIILIVDSLAPRNNVHLNDIYKIYDDQGKVLFENDNMSSEKVWYLREYFLLISISLIISILLSYYQYRKA
ncbi:hypothetical protein [Fulvivirga lutea]|uniref:Uncharacterized protein n=1 Tax=Fulvivirga lutea TaxID=2810512 RepID=A0A974ZZS8_9BACT|nr:hypothetical protein [Fulvivirga lutea]QSE96086.1 hypothetical protein JR347_10705 [Fulvivirga lutea]